MNDYGRIVETCWHDLYGYFHYIELDVFVVMPNHVHGIIFVGAGSPRPLAVNSTADETWTGNGGGETPPLRRMATLGQMVGYFKFQSTKEINKLRNLYGVKVWQRNYYEHVIRDEKSLNRIRDYIIANPSNWELDRENPQAKGKDEFDRWLDSFKKKPPGVQRPGACRR